MVMRQCLLKLIFSVCNRGENYFFRFVTASLLTLNEGHYLFDQNGCGLPGWPSLISSDFRGPVCNVWVKFCVVYIMVAHLTLMDVRLCY